MIVVTGAAGFIGSCIVSKLNEDGIKDLILVDCVRGDGKERNLEGKQYDHYLDKKDFLGQIQEEKLNEHISCIIHMGACSSTILQDEQYFQENNFEYTRQLALWAIKHNVRFIYASSAATYGDGSRGYTDAHETIECYRPLNLYGESKQKFDLWALKEGLLNKMVGLKFFNVFGPNEYHKGDMRSVVAKSYGDVVEQGRMALFKSYREDYCDGEQKRDFIYVQDVVNVVSFFRNNPEINGLFNVGTGIARTWNDLAKALFSAVGRETNIKYVEMPEILKTRYQYFTQAEMDKLKSVGYSIPFMTLEDSVADYALYLKDHHYL